MKNIRAKEIALIFKNFMIRTYVEVLANFLPIAASIVVFAVFVN